MEKLYLLPPILFILAGIAVTIGAFIVNTAVGFLVLGGVLGTMAVVLSNEIDKISQYDEGEGN